MRFKHVLKYYAIYNDSIGLYCHVYVFRHNEHSKSEDKT